jgi:hypothetical protein
MLTIPVEVKFRATATASCIQDAARLGWQLSAPMSTTAPGSAPVHFSAAFERDVTVLPGEDPAEKVFAEAKALAAAIGLNEYSLMMGALA